MSKLSNITLHFHVLKSIWEEMLFCMYNSPFLHSVRFQPVYDQVTKKRYVYIEKGAIRTLKKSQCLPLAHKNLIQLKSVWHYVADYDRCRPPTNPGLLRQIMAWKDGVTFVSNDSYCVSERETCERWRNVLFNPPFHSNRRVTRVRMKMGGWEKCRIDETK